METLPDPPFQVFLHLHQTLICTFGACSDPPTPNPGTGKFSKYSLVCKNSPQTVSIQRSFHILQQPAEEAISCPFLPRNFTTTSPALMLSLTHNRGNPPRTSDVPLQKSGPYTGDSCFPPIKKLIFPATPHRRALSHRWQSYVSHSRLSRSLFTR